MRLDKFLADCGIASRHRISDIIESGVVEVNKSIATTPGFNVNPGSDVVTCNGIRCRFSPKVYLILNKPKNYISTAKDGLGRRTVYNLLPMIKGTRLFPVGRLDKDAEGLMFFTNDGEMANRISHPRFQVSKVYHVVCEGTLDQESISRLLSGIWLAEGKVIPKKIEVLKRTRQITVLRITICDGKKNEIKRVLKKVGSRVIHIKRLSIGPLRLDELRTGRWRALTREEISRLKML